METLNWFVLHNSINRQRGCVQVSFPDARLCRMIMNDNEPYFKFSERLPYQDLEIIKMELYLSDWPIGVSSQFISETESLMENETRCKKVLSGTKTLLYIIDTGTLVSFEHIHKIIEIYNQDSEMLVLDSNRCIRILLWSFLEHEKHVCIHGSAAIKDGKVIVFSGDSGNGKSTNLLECIRLFGCNQLSFDTVFMRRQGSDIIVYGWPSTCNLSLGTMTDYEELLPFFPPEYSKLTYLERHANPNKVCLDAHGALDAFGAKMIPHGRLDTMVFVSFMTEVPIGLHKIKDKAEIEGLVRANSFMGETFYPQLSELWAANGNEQSVRDLSVAISEGIEVYRLNWAPSPYKLLESSIIGRL